MHGSAGRCVRGEDMSFEELARLAGMLDYREKLMKTAHLLLGAMQLEPFPAPWLWDVDQWMWENRERQQNESEMPDRTFRKLIEAKLLPKPGMDDGRYPIKPIRYLEAAMQARSLTGDEVDERIAMGRSCTSF
jgi:hypothetical protein